MPRCVSFVPRHAREICCVLSPSIHITRALLKKDSTGLNTWTLNPVPLRSSLPALRVHGAVCLLLSLLLGPGPSQLDEGGFAAAGLAAKLALGYGGLGFRV